MWSGAGGRRERLAFIELAAELAEPRRYPLANLVEEPKDPSKWVKPADLPAFALATFRGNHRLLTNLEAAAGVGVDVEGTAFDFDDGVALVRQLGLAAIVLTTFNHKPERPRIRILVPYSRPVRTPEEHRRCWWSIASRVENAGGAVDIGTKDATRLWLASAAIENAEFRAELVEGAPLDVAAALAAVPADEATAQTSSGSARKRTGGRHSGPTKPDGTPNRSNQAASTALKAARTAHLKGEDLAAAKAAWRAELLDPSNTSPAAEWLREKYADGTANGDRLADRTWRFAAGAVEARPVRQTDTGGTSRADHVAEAVAYADLAWRWHLAQPWGAGSGVTDALTLRARIRRVHDLGHLRIPVDVRSGSLGALVGTMTAWRSGKRHVAAGRFKMIHAGQRGSRRASVALMTDPAGWGGRAPLPALRERYTTEGTEYLDQQGVAEKQGAARLCDRAVVYHSSPASWLPSDGDLFHRGTGSFRGVVPFCGLVLDLVAIGLCRTVPELIEWTGASPAAVGAAVDRLAGGLPVGGRFRPRRSRFGVEVRRSEDDARPLPVPLLREEEGVLLVPLEAMRVAIGLPELEAADVLRAAIEKNERALNVDGARLRRQVRTEVERVEHRAKVEAQAEIQGLDLAAVDSIKPRPLASVEPPPVPVVAAVRELVGRFRGAGTEEELAQALGAPCGDVIRALLHLHGRGEVQAARSDKTVRARDGRLLRVPGPLVWRLIEAQHRVEDADRVHDVDALVQDDRDQTVEMPAPTFNALSNRRSADDALARLRDRARAANALPAGVPVMVGAIEVTRLSTSDLDGWDEGD